MSKFPCFLIVGAEDLQLSEAQIIAARFTIDIQKPSVDLFTVEPQPPKQHITIEQVREIKQHLFQKPINLAKKVIIFKRAHKLTPEAQNALLKILEEPPQHAIVMMLTDQQKSLLPTIISRVITVRTKPQVSRSTAKHTSLLDANEKILEDSAGIDNPHQWLDDQILNLHQALIAKVKSANLGDLEKLIKIIERCAYTKRLIESNVYAKFAIFDLIFSVL